MGSGLSAGLVDLLDDRRGIGVGPAGSVVNRLLASSRQLDAELLQCRVDAADRKGVVIVEDSVSNGFRSSLGSQLDELVVSGPGRRP